MARSRLSGGYSGNAVETASESDGSGVSGRMDADSTVLEDSSMPVRKCTGLNSSRRDAFRVPVQVIPMSNLSEIKRKGLVRRLKSELEQIRLIQKKVEVRKTNGAMLSPSSVIQSFSNGHNNGPWTENPREPSISNSVPGNGLKPSGQSQKPRGWNRGSAEKFAPAAWTSSPSATNALLMKDCEPLLKRLMNHQFAWVFKTPVDVVKLNLPDYFSVIKHPMDLGTVKTKLAKGVYRDPLEFAGDVRLTFSNAMTYNPRGNDVHIMADTLSKYFEVRWKSIEKKLPRKDAQRLPRKDAQRLPTKPATSDDVETIRPVPPSKKRKLISLSPQPEVMPPAKQVMSDQEKLCLGRELESLLEEEPVHIIDFLKEHCSNGGECAEDEIEIDIDDLSNDTLFTLRKLLDDFKQEKQKDKAKVEACEIELLNDSGPSNSSMQAFKGNDSADEEDIGRNEPPVSRYPAAETEKDKTYKMDKHSSLGSSESVSDLDKLKDHSQQKLSSFNSDCYEDGECAPTERQIPDKLYRAALLKNRFADTILKAREKTLAHVEKGDPEKLRQEREKLEMERCKEKARLQAEAQAAEDARKRAEAQAAAEARRKRELEREAARQALLQLEKTVEINENSRILKDLEMLRAVPGEQLPSSIYETSPDQSQDAVDCFTFDGSNPLEQLGLYIKAEADDDEEEDPQCAPNPLSDVEEGEID